MRVETKCNNCGSYISFWTWAEDRIKLAMDKGEFLELLCKSCKKSGKYHVNELRAEPNKFLRLFVVLLMLVVTGVVFYFIYDILFYSTSVYSVYIVGVLVFPSIAYGILIRDLRLKRNAFNWLKLNEHN